MRVKKARPYFFLPLIMVFLFTVRVNSPRASYIGWYGSHLCQDMDDYDCVSFGKIVVEKEVKTPKGSRVVKRLSDPRWEDAFPDEGERQIIMKLNRLNYQLRAGYLIAVPKDLEGKTLMSFSPFVRKIDPPGERVLIFDPALFAWAAYGEGGDLVRWGPAVGGRGGLRTPAGTYRIYSMGDVGCRSRQYPAGCQGRGCAPMPYCMTFKQGYAFHAGDLPGRHESHGCVRLFFDDAEWLNRNFVNYGTKVIIRPYYRD